jgi:Uma2 family endonuclease
MQHPDMPEALLTYAEFVAYAEAHEGRFEYVDGVAVPLYDMGIPSDTHQRLVRSITFAVHAHVSASFSNACEAIPSPAVWTLANKRQRAPDVVVYCNGKPAKLVCEVLSPNRGDDLGKKLTEYRGMPEFEEYLVVDSTQRWVRVYRRTAAGGFDYDVDLIAGSVRLHSIEYTLDIDALYNGSGV